MVSAVFKTLSRTVLAAFSEPGGAVWTPAGGSPVTVPRVIFETSRQTVKIDQANIETFVYRPAVSLPADTCGACAQGDTVVVAGQAWIVADAKTLATGLVVAFLRRTA